MLCRRRWTRWSLPRTRRESIDVTRIGKKEINNNPWGLSLHGPIMEALNAGGLLTRDNMNDPDNSVYGQSRDFYLALCRSAKAFLWATTRTNTRRDQLETGRAWVRMHLAATKAGVAFHPLSQALQEFPEMAAPHEKAHEMLAPEGGTVQMLVRLGHAGSPPPSPREALTAKIIAL